MVRTRGGYSFRPRVRFSTTEMEEAGTSAAAGVHSSGLHTDNSLQWPQLPSLRSLRDSGGIRRGWDPGPLPWCLRDDAGGPGPPSGPGHQTWGSPRYLGLSHHLPQHRRPHRPIYRRPRGLGDRCSLGPRFRGM